MPFVYIIQDFHCGEQDHVPDRVGAHSWRSGRCRSPGRRWHAGLQGERNRPSCRLCRWRAGSALEALILVDGGRSASEKALPISQPQMNISYRLSQSRAALAQRPHLHRVHGGRRWLSNERLLHLLVEVVRIAGVAPSSAINFSARPRLRFGQFHGGAIASMAMKSAPVTFCNGTRHGDALLQLVRSSRRGPATGYGRYQDLLGGPGEDVLQNISSCRP